MTLEELKRELPDLDVRCDDHLAETLAFAERRGLLEDLLKGLRTLNGWRAVLMRDHAPWSFYFTTKYSLACGNGGLLYYGPGDSGAGAPRFSVRQDSSREGWEINT